MSGNQISKEVKVSDKLRPCPFCRSTDASIEIGGIGKYYHVECGKCGAQGPGYEAKRKYGKQWPRDAAIRAWNGDVYIEEVIEVE